MFTIIKIEVIDIRNSGDYMQMGEFSFTKYREQNVKSTYQARQRSAQEYDLSAYDEADPLIADFKEIAKNTIRTDISAGDFDVVESDFVALSKLLDLVDAYAAGAKFVCLDGFTTWGDGQPENLMDGNLDNKWGTDLPSDGTGAFAIYRAGTPVKPFYYTVLTGGDTGNYPGRNWKTWQIYAFNGSILDASRNSDKWVLIDSHENVGQDLLPGRSKYEAPFGMTPGAEEEYIFFKIEVAEPFDGNLIQMNELTFGTEEDFNADKAARLAELNAYEVPASASAADKKAYAEAVKAVEDATPETLLAAYTEGKKIQRNIFDKQKKGNTYQIGSASDYDFFATSVNGGEYGANAILTADIDLAGVSAQIIGTESNPYTGTFDGQGHSIKNFTYENSGQSYVGLFGVTNGATFKKVAVVDATLNGDVNVGVLVGRAVNTTITSVAIINPIIEGRDHVGGLAGEIRGDKGCTVSNNYVQADVVSREYQAGGLIGTAFGGLVENNLFVGNVSAGGGQASGLISLKDGTESNFTIQNNAIFADNVYAGWGNGSANAIMRGNADTYKNNYSNKETIYTDVKFTLTNPDDFNGGQVEKSAGTTYDLYAETLGWDFENEWKFLYGGHYPILSWMQVDEPAYAGVSFGEIGFATLAVPYDIDFTVVPDVQAYAVIDKGSYAHLEPVTSARGGEAVLLEYVGAETPAGEAAKSNATEVDGNVITIVNAGVVPGSQTIVIDMNAQGWKNREVVSGSDIKFAGGTISFSKTGKSNDAAYYTVPEGVRMYANNVLTINTPDNQIAKVVITCDFYDGTNFVGNEDRTIEYGTNSISITNNYYEEVGGVQLRVKSIAITFAGDGSYVLPYAIGVEGTGENDLIPAFEDVEANGSQYIFGVVDDVLGFHVAEIGTIIPAGKAYLRSGEAASAVKAINATNTETAISEVDADKAQQSNVIYDLSGRRVEKATKGVYIINGKKVLK